MKVDILYPKVPPAYDAIGEHNVCLAAALNAAGVVVRLLHLADSAESIPGVDLVRLERARSDGYGALSTALQRHRTDWLITEYNPFSYGRYGVNARLPLALAAARRTAPQTRQALYVHEAFAPARSPRLALMAAAHRAQFAAVRQLSDLVLTSSDVWADDFGRWWPRIPARQIRIGSNLPRATGARRDVRRRFGIDDDAFVAVVFGGLGGDRNPDMLREALRTVSTAGGVCVYVGPATASFKKIAQQAAAWSISLGRLDAEVAADVLRCADIGLAPFIDGVSPRRGSFLAMLQQGLAVATTHGALTGPAMLQAAAAGAFLLTDCTPGAFAEGVQAVMASDSMRAALGQRAMAFYNESHDWTQIARSYVGALASERESVRR